MNCNREPDLKNIIAIALKEDIGEQDITTKTFIPKNKQIKAMLLTKEACVICGLGVAQAVFKTQDKKIKFKPLVKEGVRVSKGRKIAVISGKAQSILTAERTALNFLSHLSGITTKTRCFVKRILPYKTKIIDTRKTIPGLRLLEKYAVRIGGGFNHRFSLDEMIMIKDNHLKIIGSYTKLRCHRVKKYKLELEVNNLKEFKEALGLHPDIIMLDNMSIKEMKCAVLLKKLAKSKILLEASGNITMDNIRKVASTGVNTISIGGLTHSVDSIDISLEIL